MKVLAIASLENRENLDEQIAKQTVQPYRVIYHEDKNPAKGIENRRKRIAQNQDKLKEIVKAYKHECDLVWQLEGDSVLPANCLDRLLDNLYSHHIQKDPANLGYISGIQVGRHGLYHIGAWRNITKDSFESIDYKLKGIQKVDATGLYCLLAPIETWLDGKASWNGEPYGPDVNWSLSLNKDIYVDMNLEIGHKIKGGIIMPSDPSTTNVRFNKTAKGWEYKAE